MFPARTGNGGAKSEVVVSQGVERRKWPRVEAGFRIRLKPLGGQTEAAGQESFCTKNISTGGLLFESSGGLEVSPGSVFDVEISMPLAKFGFASSRRLEARGKVCRVREREQEGRREVALEFMAPPRFVTA
jgi:c-di-GMP-binding flagellar brake protein YcgR